MKEGYQIKLSITPYVKPNAFSFKAKLTKFYLEEEEVTRPSRNGISMNLKGNMRFYHMLAATTTKTHQRHEIMFAEGAIKCDTTSAIDKLFNLLKIRDFPNMFFEFFDELNNEAIIHGLNLVLPDWLKLINQFQAEYLQLRYLRNKITKLEQKMSGEGNLINELNDELKTSKEKISEANQQHHFWSEHKLDKLQTNQADEQSSLDQNEPQYEADKKQHERIQTQINEAMDIITKLKTSIQQNENAKLLLKATN